jgi:hypothetical protein
MKTEVVNIYHGDEFDVFIGRSDDGIYDKQFACPRDIRASVIGREEMIKQYRSYVFANPNIVRACAQLKGLRLGCFCAPHPCHGDVLAEIADTYFPKAPIQERQTRRLFKPLREEAESWEEVMKECRR